MITILLILLGQYGLLPRVLVELLPLIVKYGPAVESLIENLIIKIIEDEKNHKIVFTNNVPSMIPGYDANGNVTFIPNPDYKPAANTA